MQRTQVYLPQSQIRVLKRVAAEQNISMSEAVRRAIYGSLVSKKVPQGRKGNTGSWLLSLAREAERRGVRGPKDLATNMDKYLYDKDFS